MRRVRGLRRADDGQPRIGLPAHSLTRRGRPGRVNGSGTRRRPKDGLPAHTAHTQAVPCTPARVRVSDRSGRRVVALVELTVGLPTEAHTHVVPRAPAYALWGPGVHKPRRVQA